MSLVLIAWARYLRLLKDRPVLTKATTSGLLLGFSEYLAQKIRGAKGVQLRRVILMALYGLVYVGPSAHFVHTLLDKIFHSKQDMKTVVKKVLLEQLTYGPFNNLLALAFISRVLEGRPMQLTYHRVLRQYPQVQLNGWRLWPLAALVNYRFVPIQLRVLFVNIVAIFWSTFLILSSKTSSKKLSLD